MISLQSQVEQLQKQLAGAQMLQTPQATSKYFLKIFNKLMSVILFLLYPGSA